MDDGQHISSVDDIRRYCLNLWLNNRVLRACMGSETLFPLIITLQQPESAGSTTAGLMQWKAQLEEHCQCHRGYGYAIEYADIQLPHMPNLRLPQKLIFAQLNDLVQFIHKGDELNCFCRLYGQLRRTDERLGNWCESRPLQLLEYAQILPRLLSIVVSLSEMSLSVEAALHSNTQLAERELLLQHQDLIGEWLQLLAAKKTTL